MFDAGASGRVHVIGAGLSGLATAVRLAEAGVSVVVHEGAGRAGGRCRSFHDKVLDREIDNGNHFLMSGNRHAIAFLETIGAADRLEGPARAIYPFVDVRDGRRWTVDLGDGASPLWVFDKNRRPPDTALKDYLAASGLPFAGPDRTVSDYVGEGGPLFERFWEPFTFAVLNTTPERGQARLVWSVLRETFLRGGRYSRPLVAKGGLGPAFVEPALAWLEARGVEVRFNSVLRSLRFADDRVAALAFGDGEVALGAGDAAVVALPPAKLRRVLPDLDPPGDESSIVNVHYRLAEPPPTDALQGGIIIGLIGAKAQWAVVRGDIVSLTISAADRLGIDRIPHEELGPSLWKETKIALGIEGVAYEAVRIITEKRATFDQSPEGAKRRLPQNTQWANLVLAGDHVETGVPATIEGSIRSGDRAAALVRDILVTT